MLSPKFYCDDENAPIELSVDDVSRGPLLGAVYCACVVLPRDGSFDATNIKDSKKYSKSKKQQQLMREVGEYIKTHAVAWAIAFEDEQKIDEVNILQATQLAFHKAIREVVEKLGEPCNRLKAVIDGNTFKPCFIKSGEDIQLIDYVCVEGGDAIYTGVSCASIIAKLAHDDYIRDLCALHPELDERYGLLKNYGYGTKQHLDGIAKYGITQWHRRTFAPCKRAIIKDSVTVCEIVEDDV